LNPGLSSPLAEPLDLPARVDDALRAREERVAHGADLGLQLLARGSGRERVPARAGHDRVFIEGGMDLDFHGFSREGSLPSQGDTGARTQAPSSCQTGSMFSRLSANPIRAANRKIGFWVVV